MSYLKFKDLTWDELCPLFIEKNDSYEKFATGVLINIFDNTFLLTASHVIDESKEVDKRIFIPTINGFEAIAGILYHRYLQENENRKDDLIDFSYFKLFPEMIEVLHESLTPISESMIAIENDFTFNFNENLVPIENREMMKRMKDLHENPSEESKEQLEYINDFKLKTTISFAGYPNTKTKKRINKIMNEQVFYHGSKVEEGVYVKHDCNVEDNVIASFGKKGAMNSSFQSINPTKKVGISGGGVYKLIDTNLGLDRKLIGIGHTKKDKEHLLIGTNIKFCLDVIKKRLDREKK